MADTTDKQHNSEEIKNSSKSTVEKRIIITYVSVVKKLNLAHDYSFIYLLFYLGLSCAKSIVCVPSTPQ